MKLTGPWAGVGEGSGTHIRSLSSFFLASCFHFVLWYGVLGPQRMHLGPPFKFTVPESSMRVSETSPLLGLSIED